METQGLLRKIIDLGCSIAAEERLGLYHFRLTVDDEYVEAARKLVYESVPVVFKVDVIGASEPRFIAIAPDDWNRFQAHYDNQTPCEVGGRLWLVQSIEFETNPVWRGQVGLAPFRPVYSGTVAASLGYVTLTDNPVDPECRVYDIVSGETTQPADDTKPNHVRDAVRANQ